MPAVVFDRYELLPAAYLLTAKWISGGMCLYVYWKFYIP